MSPLTIGNTMQCAQCRTELAADVTVYRTQQTSPMHTIHICEACKWEPDDWRSWRPPEPCLHCGRPIATDTRRPPPVFLCCSPACDKEAYKVVLRNRRHALRQERICKCGQVFIPNRTDAIHCSPACKQRAYRVKCADNTAPEQQSPVYSGE